MPQIFYLPVNQPLSSAGALQAGAKLYFYTTATSSPLDTYSDYALATPNPNPLIADANGTFAQAFLKNTPRYRAVLKTSADVTLYTWDDVGPDTAATLAVPTLAGSNVFTGATTKLSASEVRLLLDETDAGTDKRLWDIDIDAGILKLRTRTDADGAGNTILAVTRGTGTAVTSVDLSQTWNYQSFEVANKKSGSFTATLTGMTTTVTGTVKYRIVGDAFCVLYAEANITGTSNTTAMNLTGLPSACQPGTTAQHRATTVYGLTDNNQVLQGDAAIDGAGGGAPGTIFFSLYTTAAVANRVQAGGLFTNSGTKGIVNGFTMVYAL